MSAPEDDEVNYVYIHRFLAVMMSLMTHLEMWAGLKVRPSRGRSRRVKVYQQKPKLKNTKTKKSRTQNQERVRRRRRAICLQTWYAIM